MGRKHTGGKAFEKCREDGVLLAKGYNPLHNFISIQDIMERHCPNAVSNETAQ